MASAQLQLKFGTIHGEKTFRFNKVKTTGIAQSVKNLINVMIANGSIYANPPLSPVSAKVVITTENVIDISD